MNPNPGPLTQFQNAVGQPQDIFPQFQNRRVVNISEKPTEWFQLFDNNEPNKDFTNQALYGIQNCSPLSKAFFSKANVELVQDMIRYNVYIKSDKKYIIGPQSNIELEVIMRSIYLQNSRNLPFKIREQIKELNSMVVHNSTPRILSSLSQYLGFLYRVENLPTPIELPKNLSSAGTRLLRSVTSTF